VVGKVIYKLTVTSIIKADIDRTANTAVRE
jgi:hypothetical protein